MGSDGSVGGVQGSERMEKFELDDGVVCELRTGWEFEDGDEGKVICGWDVLEEGEIDIGQGNGVDAETGGKAGIGLD